MKAREFCRLWFDANNEKENKRGYRAECVRLLSHTLGVQIETVNSKWGDGIDFENMPSHYEKTLSYANSLRSIVDVAATNPELADILSNRMRGKAVISP